MFSDKAKFLMGYEKENKIQRIIKTIAVLHIY